MKGVKVIDCDVRRGRVRGRLASSVAAIAAAMLVILALDRGAAATGEPTPAEPTPAELTAIELPGGAPGIGFDDLRFSASLGRVLVPAGRSGNLDLVDPETRAVTVIGGFSNRAAYSGGHGEGITSADAAGTRLLVTDRTSHELHLLDPSTRASIAVAKLAASPDYVRFVSTREAWVTEPDKEQIEIFSIGEGTPPVLGHVALAPIAGGPESLVIDAARGRAYTNLWAGETVAVDLATRHIVERWKNDCRGSRGIALDEAQGRVFVGCAEGRVVVLDALHGGERLGSAEVSRGVDIIDYDPERKHVYAPGARGGSLAVVSVSGRGVASVVGSVPVPNGAHCVVSDRRGHVFVCDPDRGRLLTFVDSFVP